MRNPAPVATGLYEKRKAVYPRQIDGKFRRRRAF